MQELQQLENLVSRYEFDTPENRRLLKKYERELHKLTLKERLVSRPGFKEWIEYLTLQIDVCESANATDRKLTEEQRRDNFAKIDLARHFLSYFDIKDQKKSLETTINEDIDRAKSSY